MTRRRLQLLGVSKRTIYTDPGFPIWIRLTHPKAVETLAKPPIPTFTRRVRQDLDIWSSVSRYFIGKNRCSGLAERQSIWEIRADIPLSLPSGEGLRALRQ